MLKSVITFSQIIMWQEHQVGSSIRQVMLSSMPLQCAEPLLQPKGVSLCQVPETTWLLTELALP